MDGGLTTFFRIEQIFIVKPQREEDKLMEHEEARGKQTHSVIATLIGPIIAYNPMKF